MTGPYVIAFPAPGPMLSANRGSQPAAPGRHGTIGSIYRRRLRAITYAQAQIAGLPKGLARARIDIVLHFPRNARRDTANYHPYVAKPVVDALGQQRVVKRPGGGYRVEPGYGTLLGDDPARMHCNDCPHIRFGEPCGPTNPRYPHGQIVVTITDLSHTVDVQPVLFDGGDAA